MSEQKKIKNKIRKIKIIFISNIKLDLHVPFFINFCRNYDFLFAWKFSEFWSFFFYRNNDLKEKIISNFKFSVPNWKCRFNWDNFKVSLDLSEEFERQDKLLKITKKTYYRQRTAFSINDALLMLRFFFLHQPEDI